MYSISHPLKKPKTKQFLETDCFADKPPHDPFDISVLHVVDEGVQHGVTTVYITEAAVSFLQDCEIAKLRYTPRPIS